MTRGGTPPLRRAVLILLALCAGACTSICPQRMSIVAAGANGAAENAAIPLEQVPPLAALAGMACFVLDPLAPNWEIRQTQLGADLYHLVLRMKRVNTGGDGEARAVFHRRAAQLARSGGFAGYQVLAYSEAIESVLLPQRVGEGWIQLSRAPR